MLEETTIIKSKAIFSDDKEHRLLLRKEWDSEKQTAMVIMINPNTADTVNFDMTTMLVLNNVSKLGFGSVNIVNLYSRIMEKLNLRFNGDDELIADEADEIIQQYAAMSDAIIIAWGTIGKNTLRVRERQKYLLELIKQHAGKMYQIGRNACHPLTPAVRREWVLEPYEMEEIET
ncbi:DUF1643 domain-containing protein [Ruminococcus callidus]|mgnify:FL=1|uniref:DUF1643 domain-containing protein n=1 Tax=Ruminococcus callidus TaxID=40519 RepID=UPI003522CE58